MAGLHPGCTTQQYASAAIMGLKTPGSDLKRQPPGHLAHGREQRQGAVLQLNGFIAERRHLPVQQRSGELFCCGKMQVGKQNKAGT